MTVTVTVSVINTIKITVEVIVRDKLAVTIKVTVTVTVINTIKVTVASFQGDPASYCHQNKSFQEPEEGNW